MRIDIRLDGPRLLCCGDVVEYEGRRGQVTGGIYGGRGCEDAPEFVVTFEDGTEVIVVTADVNVIEEIGEMFVPLWRHE